MESGRQPAPRCRPELSQPSLGEDAAVIFWIPPGQEWASSGLAGSAFRRLPVGGRLEVNLDRVALGQGFLLEGDPKLLSDQLPQEMGPFPFLVFASPHRPGPGDVDPFKAPTEVWTELETGCGLIFTFYIFTLIFNFYCTIVDLYYCVSAVEQSELLILISLLF